MASALNRGRVSGWYEVNRLRCSKRFFLPDDLGVRNFLSEFLMRDKIEITGMILMDMISYHERKQPFLMQINAGSSPASLELARFAYDVSQFVLPTEAPANMTAAFRWRFDPLSYLYNTDGVVMSEAGFPVVLINEHINFYENFNRPDYHQSGDLVSTLNFHYGTAIAKVAIETVAQLAAS